LTSPDAAGAACELEDEPPVAGAVVVAVPPPQAVKVRPKAVMALTRASFRFDEWTIRVFLSTGDRCDQ